MQIEDYETHPADRRGAKGHRNGAMVAGILLFVVLAYLFLYPVIVVLLEDHVPPGTALYEVIVVSVAPLTWLYENVTAYHKYLSLLEDLLM